MKLDRVKYRDGRPYVETHPKSRKSPMRTFGAIRSCQICGDPFFATSHNIKRGNGRFCTHSCARSVRLGSLSPGWKGGRTTNGANGYILIFTPSHPFHTQEGYVLEHRLVMESLLGRYLTPSETVHHRNESPSDNRPCNLHLFATNGKHTSFHSKNRIYVTGKKHASKYRRLFNKTLRELSVELGISPQGVCYRIKKNKIQRSSPCVLSA